VAHAVLAEDRPAAQANRVRDLRDARVEPQLARPAASTPSRVPATTGADDDWEQF
jgi:hypothetical protein